MILRSMLRIGEDGSAGGGAVNLPSPDTDGAESHPDPLAGAFEKAQAFLEGKSQAAPPPETPAPTEPPPGEPPAPPAEDLVYPPETPPAQPPGEKFVYPYVYEGTRLDLEQQDLDQVLYEGLRAIQGRRQEAQPAKAPEAAPAAEQGKDENPAVALMKQIQKDLAQQKSERDKEKEQARIQARTREVTAYLTRGVTEAIPTKRVFKDFPQFTEKPKDGGESQAHKLIYADLAAHPTMEPAQAVERASKFFEGIVNAAVSQYAKGKIEARAAGVGTPGGRGAASVPKKQTMDDIKHGRTLEAAEQFLRERPQ
jgi:hypothetical protein